MIYSRQNLSALDKFQENYSILQIALVVYFIINLAMPVILVFLIIAIFIIVGSKEESTKCDISVMHNCKGTTRYIRDSRVCDRIIDCNHGDDEDSCSRKKYSF